MNKPIVGGVLVIIGLCLLGLYGTILRGASALKAPEVVASGLPIEVGPVTLARGYERNEVGADNEYLGHRLALTAVAGEIRKDAFGAIVIDLPASPPDDSLGIFARHIEARVKKDFSAEVGRLARGDVIAIDCIGNGYRFHTVQLTDCSLLAAQPHETAFAEALGLSYEYCLLERDGPRAAASVAAGHLPDGGAVPLTVKEFVTKMPSVMQENESRIAQLGQHRLPCGNLFVELLQDCHADPRGSPQCDSALVHAARHAMHH